MRGSKQKPKSKKPNIVGIRHQAQTLGRRKRVGSYPWKKLAEPKWQKKITSFFLRRSQELRKKNWSQEKRNARRSQELRKEKGTQEKNQKRRGNEQRSGLRSQEQYRALQESSSDILDRSTPRLLGRKQVERRVTDLEERELWMWAGSRSDLSSSRGASATPQQSWGEGQGWGLDLTPGPGGDLVGGQDTFQNSPILGGIKALAEIAVPPTSWSLGGPGGDLEEAQAGTQSQDSPFLYPLSFGGFQPVEVGSEDVMEEAREAALLLSLGCDERGECWTESMETPSRARTPARTREVLFPVVKQESKVPGLSVRRVEDDYSRKRKTDKRKSLRFGEI